jgi:hypothetical protein
MPPTRQFPGRRRRDVRVEVGGVERQHIGGQREAPHRRPRDRDLGLRQLLLGDVPRQPVERLSGERRGGEARDPRDARPQERTQVPFGPRHARPLDRDGQHHLAHGRPRLRAGRAARSVDGPHHVELLGYPRQRPDVPDATGSHRASLVEVGDGRAVGGAQHGLSGKGSLPDPIPQRLGGNAIPATTDHPFKDVHSFI